MPLSDNDKPTDRPGPAKFSTNINGLDSVLHGGLPVGRMTLVTGGPGSGKTVFALEVMYRRAQAGEPGLFVTFEESENNVFINAKSLGWDLRELKRARKLMVVHAQLPREFVLAGDFGIQGLIANLGSRIAAIGARYLVLDALDVLIRNFDDPQHERQEIENLYKWLDEVKLTSLLTLKATNREINRYPFLEFKADCVLNLDQRMENQIRTRRLTVSKYRGSGFMNNEIPYVISSRGIRVLPVEEVRLTAKTREQPRMPSGNETLDGVLGGGFNQASSVLLTGQPGTGKSILASSIAAAACSRTQRVLYITYEETEPLITEHMLGIGLDLQPHLDSGRLKIVDILPEAMGVEEHLIRLLDVCEEVDPQLVIIDSISAIKRMGGLRGGFDLLLRLTGNLKQRGSILILINQYRNGNHYQRLSGFEISSLIDTVIILEYIWRMKDFRRRLTIMKSRGSNHSHRYHEMRISKRGIEISPETQPEAGASAARPETRT